MHYFAPAKKVFCKKFRDTSGKFSTKIEKNLPIEFTDFNIEQTPTGMLTMHQNLYLHKPKELLLDADFLAFWSMRMKLGWLANTRSDVLFEIGTIAQVRQ